MSLSATEAAKQVGMAKATIVKAMRSGKVSATKGNNGEWEIEPVELFRVYKPASASGKPDNTVADNATLVQIDSLQEKVLLLERIINVKDDIIRDKDTAINDKNDVIRDKDDAIRDLRTRLDAETDERRRLSMTLADVHKVLQG
jgi:hypothetical protein